MESDITQSAGVFKFLAWLEVHKKQVMYGVVAVLTLGLIVWFVLYQREQRLLAAEAALSEVFVPQITSAASKADAPAGYLKVASEYSSSPAALRAQLLAATSFFTEGKFAEAQAQFEKFYREHRQGVLGLEAQLGIAAALDAQGKTNDAFNAYKAIVDRRGTDAASTQAKFALARMYVAQNKPEMALPLYEDITKTEAYGSSLSSEAGMRAEELKQKYPQLVPPPASVTNAAPLTIKPAASNAPAVKAEAP